MPDKAKICYTKEISGLEVLVMQHKDVERRQIPPAEKGYVSLFQRMRFLAVAISTVLFLSSGTANAQMCGTPVYYAYAIGSPTWMSMSPCSLPQPTPATFALQPGQAFQQHLQSWWTGQLLPNLQHMTQQLYAYRIWETFELGQLKDVEAVNHTARVEQEQRVTAQQGVQPADQVCVAGSSQTAEARAALTAAALTQGFKQDILRRAHNAVENPVDGSYTPPGMTPASDAHARWLEFCQEFYDPNSNGGKGVCRGASKPGTVMNQDIGVEDFLFRDTIDLNNPDEYKAAEALLINIVEPIIQENLSPTVLTSPQGQERLLRQQHIEAIRNVAADVVGSIIARRAPLSQTDANLATKVVEIRKQAGIEACPSSPQPTNGTPCYSQTPSYNEIMLALTKERFFAPSYFSNMEANPGAVQQEQAAIDGYTTVQLQDIYKLQEQINALLAARASLKLATDQMNSETSAAPAGSQ